MSEPDTLVKNGNIQWFPKVLFTSYNNHCPQYEVSLDDDGENKIVFSGSMLAPTKEHSLVNPFHNYDELNYQIIIS